MSAIPRTRRSTSRARPNTSNDIAQANHKAAVPKNDSPDRSTPSTPPHDTAHTQTHELIVEGPELAAATMLSTISAPTITLVKAPGASPMDNVNHIADNRSSSLSELDDASDDQSEATQQANRELDSEDNDSEAETERLERTPRKLTRAGTDTSLLSETPYTRTPSKLAYTRTANQEHAAQPTSAIAEDVTAVDRANLEISENPLHSLSLVAASEAAALEYAGKKRKRTSAERSPRGEQDEDERASKRSSSVRTSNGMDGSEIAGSAQVDVEDEFDEAEERLAELAQEEIDLEEQQANIAEETINELTTAVKHAKPRKGGKRGKRKVGDTGCVDAEIHAHAEVQEAEAEAEAEGDEEDSAALDEEVARKKAAIDVLGKIEKRFKIFREKMCDEHIAQFERELEMLKQPICQHPEYLAMTKCVDQRRHEKTQYETRLLDYKLKNLEIITVAERHQMHSQFFQTVRDIREDLLAECNQRVFELHRGRRQLGCDETEYMVRLPEQRSEQIKHQIAYNLEVSVLSGVAKYVGFPAAPNISPARPSEVDEDLRAMRIVTRAPAPPPSFRTYNRTTTADEAAAEEQFLESTPWANPRHPSHQETRYTTGPTRLSNYQTPAGQRRVVDLTASNGSASTIEASSNPPSSAPHHTNGRTSESESPVLYLKRAPIDHLVHGDTHGSTSRNSGTLGREAYDVHSSPAPLDELNTQRWPGSSVRPLNVNAAGSSPGSVAPTRTEAARVPLTQRSAVSVGSGIFSR